MYFEIKVDVPAELKVDTSLQQARLVREEPGLGGVTTELSLVVKALETKTAACARACFSSELNTAIIMTHTHTHTHTHANTYARTHTSASAAKSEMRPCARCCSSALDT